MGEAYDKDLVNKAMQIAEENNIEFIKVFIWLPVDLLLKPPAEYKYSG